MTYDPEYHRQYREKNKERRRLTNQAWYQRNKKKHKEYTYSWRIDNPEKNKAIEKRANGKSQARKRGWYHETIDERHTYQRNWRKDNPGKTAEYSKRHHDKDPEKRLESNRAYDRKRSKTPGRRIQLKAVKQQRRAQKLQAPINDLTHVQWMEIQEVHDHRCAYCKKRCKGKLTQDHITPLSQGGSHTASNVIPACRNCNSKKNAGAVLCPVQPLLLTLAPARKKTGS